MLNTHMFFNAFVTFLNVLHRLDEQLVSHIERRRKRCNFHKNTIQYGTKYTLNRTQHYFRCLTNV